jgi:hypothetical protein
MIEVGVAVNVCFSPIKERGLRGGGPIYIWPR